MTDMVGVPATTAAGALAALTFIERETEEQIGPDEYQIDRVIKSLVQAVRGHIERAG